MNLKDEVNTLIEAMTFVQNRALREIMVSNFVKEYGEIPDEYKDAVDAVMDL